MKHIHRLRNHGGSGHADRHPGHFFHALQFARLGRGHLGGGSHRGGGGFGRDEENFSRGRKFSSDDLQVLLLALLVDEPRHGYELIKMLETRSNGFYAPSPGMVYPALTYLEELGQATVENEGNRKRYALTAAGREHLEKNRERVEMLWARLSFFAQRMGMVRRALAGEDGLEEHVPVKELIEARHRLKRALFVRARASSAQQLAFAQVLDRAAAEIESLAEPDAADSAKEST